MTEQEIKLAMEGLFKGASKVRAQKYAKQLSGHVNREFTSRIAAQMWKEEKDYLNTA